LRLRRRKNLTPRLERAADLLWPEEPAAASAFVGGRPLSIEIGCGMGGFVSALAEADPGGVFLAVERDSNVAVRAMEHIREMGLSNVRFCLADAVCLTDIVEPGSVSALYLNFSDPWPHRRHEHRRLTHRAYLRLYRDLLRPGGTLILKTDNENLFRFTERELTSEGWPIIALDENLPDGSGNIRTEYETRFRESGRPIYYISAGTFTPNKEASHATR
jgi:tRNA (guanine-N7-)-methyltransferase